MAIIVRPLNLRHVWNVGAVWNVAVAVAYAVGALVVIKGLGPEC